MKRKILYLLGFLTLMIPMSVRAEETTITLNCDKNKVKPSEEITCTIKGSSEQEITGVDVNVKLGENLTLASIQKGEFENGTCEDGWCSITTADNKNGDFDIATFGVKVSDTLVGADTSITLEKITYTNANFEKINIDDVNKNIRIMSTINTLDDIKLDGVTIEGYSKDKTSYDVTVASEKTSVTITPTKTNANASISGDTEEVTLKYGINTFNINVTSESGTVKTYTLKINRPDNRSGEKYLLQFAFKDLDINFDKATTGYKNNINNKYQKLAICGGEYKIDSLNILCIDGENIKYSDKANLNGLKFNGIDIRKIFEGYVDAEEKCNENETECTYFIDGKEVGKDYYNPDTDEELFYYILGDLKLGNNQLIVTVQAENETEQDYTFILNRLNEKGEDVSKDEITNPDTNISSYVLITVMLLGAGLILYKKYKNPIYR